MSPIAANGAGGWNPTTRPEREIWLIYYHKDSGKPRIPYNDAVEEALCFGWIDSTVKNIDAERYAQRFSPRNPKTAYSQTNKERLRRLIAAGKVIPEVLAVIATSQTTFSKYRMTSWKALKPNPRPGPTFRNCRSATSEYASPT